MVLLDDPRVIRNRAIISARLAEAMKEKSYSPSTLATVMELQGDGAKWNPNLIKAWIEGKKDPKFCVVATLADVLKVSPNYLAGLTVNKSSNISKEEAKKALGLEMLSDDAIESLSSTLKEEVDLDDLAGISLLLADLSHWDHLTLQPNCLIDAVSLTQSESFPQVSIAEVVEYFLTHSQETINRILRSIIRIMELYEIDSFSDALAEREDAELNNSNSKIMKLIKELRAHREHFGEQLSIPDMMAKLKKDRERHKEKIARECVVEEAIREDALRACIRKCWEERVNGQSDTKSKREEFADSMIGVVAQSLSDRICTLKRLRDIQSKE